MSEKRVVVSPTSDDVFSLVADKFVSRARKILSRTGQFRVLLTGGETQRHLLRAIAVHPTASQLEWKRAAWFVGDERFVAAGSDQRNDRMAWQTCLRDLGVSTQQLSAPPSTDDSPSVEQAAMTYKDRLREATGEWEGDGPLFDLALVGMGADGHVLSVFPGSVAANAQVSDVLAVSHSPKPPSERITLTLPLLNRSERVWIVAHGAEKAGAVGLALADAAPQEVPVAGVLGTRSTKLFIDGELAELLPAELTQRRRVWTAADERADYVPEALR